MSQLRWGLVGASDIAATRVIPAMRRLGHRPVAVMSSSPDRAKAYAQTNDLDVATTSLDALLGRADVDAVYISTTNELHASQALAASAAGKHVLCEKPLALSMSGAWSIVDACREAQVVLAVNHHLPAAGTHRAIRQLIAGGAVGTPLAVRVFHAVHLPERLRSWRLAAPERGGGVIFDITCHDAAAVDAILGRPAIDAAAIAVRQGQWPAMVEDAVMSTVRYEGDVLVQTHDAFTIPYASTGLEVHGTQGSIIARGVMVQDPVGSIMVRDSKGEHLVTTIDRSDLYDTTLEAFADAVHNAGKPIVDGAAGVRALAVALAVKEAARTARTTPVDDCAATTASRV